MKERIGRARLYFQRGYGIYLSLPLSLLNVSLILYNFAFRNLVFIPDTCKHVYIFAPAMLFLIIPTSILLGKWDFIYGTYRAEARRRRELSPEWEEVNEKLDNITRIIERITDTN